MARIRRIFLFLVFVLYHVLLTESVFTAWLSRGLQQGRSWIGHRVQNYSFPWRIVPGHAAPGVFMSPHARAERRFSKIRPLDFRGGSDGRDDENTILDPTEDNDLSTPMEDAPREIQVEIEPPTPAIRRHSSDVIKQILDPHATATGSSSNNDNDESMVLRELIASRTEDYIAELEEAIQNHDHRLPHPRKLLHYLAPKVPAIKQSPDVNLRVHSSRSDIDPGVAACIIGKLARVCELYDKEMTHRADQAMGSNGNHDKPKSIASEVTTDRRFEQLVECVISGVNVQKRKAEFLQRQMDKQTDEAADIEEVLDEEHAQVDEGLNIRDMCRAAWGISILGAHHLETLGGVQVNDLLLGLSLRVRALLLAKLQLLRHDDILNSNEDTINKISTEERLSEISEELAVDAATAMWAFACVRACTGMRSPSLFEAACSLLCQDPVDLRRRAQESNVYEEGSPNIGNSDVIDRLALSESVEGDSIISATDPAPLETEKDVLLSWLSPTEVNDVLWALALHGSNTSTLDNDIPLSETASALREIAYDRMVEWLEIDLAGGNDAKEPQLRLGIEKELERENQDVVTFEVVDAAALLASQESHEQPNSLSTGCKEIPVENLTVHSNSVLVKNRSVQEVEVVDAAKLVFASAKSRDEIKVETEVIVAPISLMKSNTTVSAQPEEATRFIQESSGSTSNKPIFSPHDLASVAWSVTELRDPLKTTIVGMIIELFSKLGYDGLYLSGGDLSNLIWAFAKYRGDADETMKLRITGWIAEHAYRASESSDVLRVFQPPELGRFMWALASILSTQTDVAETVRTSFYVLLTARKALKAAADNVSLFSTEDLARTAWAFLELWGEDLSHLKPSEISALGRLVATIDMSLHRWERGQCGNNSPSQGSHSDASIFSSFFGRPRINLPVLEFVLGGEEEEEEDSLLATLPQKTNRPKLQDLSIDPATLCKASCNFQRLSKYHPYINSGWSMTRVTVRLLASKNGRLMKECSIHDLIRLCEATVLSEVDGHGRELIIGLFARQLVSLLNKAVEDTSGENSGSAIVLADITSSEAATLVWTLGELGVKVSPSAEGNQNANRKLRIISLEPVISKINVESLDSARLHGFIRGLVMMKVENSHQTVLSQALHRIKDMFSRPVTSKAICTFAEDVGLVRESLSGQQRIKHTDSDTISPGKTENASNHQDVKDQEMEVEESSSGDLEDEDLLALTDELLCLVAKAASDMSKSFAAGEIRRLLEVYSLLPFQADEMVQLLASEVSERLTAIEELSGNQALGLLLKNADEKASVFKRTLYEESDDKSFFDSMKTGFMSLFGSKTEENTNTEDGDIDSSDALTEQIASMLQASIAATSAASHSAQAEESALQMRLDSLLASLHEDAAFELGRAIELIENYKRIEFSTGRRRSRYDSERRKEIAKRVLSRLIP